MARPKKNKKVEEPQKEVGEFDGLEEPTPENPQPVPRGSDISDESPAPERRFVGFHPITLEKVFV